MLRVSRITPALVAVYAVIAATVITDTETALTMLGPPGDAFRYGAAYSVANKVSGAPASLPRPDAERCRMRAAAPVARLDLREDPEPGPHCQVGLVRTLGTTKR